MEERIHHAIIDNNRKKKTPKQSVTRVLQRTNNRTVIALEPSVV